jgi:D-glycero-D-manno-heptose 1,7-bisphosphate phosphatase
LRRQVPIDDIRVCYHDDSDDCTCRKPRPGLLLEAASIWEIDLTNSFMVGDHWKDIEAGRRAGCKTVLIECVYSGAERCNPDFQATSLREAADWILKHNKAHIERSRDHEKFVSFERKDFR